MYVKTLRTLLLALVTVAFAACGGQEATPDAATPSEPEASTAAPGTTPAPSGDVTLSGDVEGGVRTITLTPVGNEMKFEQTELGVQAGETVRIVFENTATSPAMQHNVVVVTSHDVINRVGQAALSVGGDYVPEDEAVIAATPLAQPGETVEVTFTAPETPGTYAYICTFPGHYMMMQGTLHVVAAGNA